MSNRLCARLGSNLLAVWRIFFFAFLMFKYYFFIIWVFLLIFPKYLEMPSRGTPKIPRFKIIVSMCECCCPFFIFCLFLAFTEKIENSHHAKIVNYNAFSEFLQMVPKLNFIGPFKLFFFIGLEQSHISFYFHAFLHFQLFSYYSFQPSMIKVSNFISHFI